ncbi:MAG: MoaD family protein [Chloroflexi bacterium]|nr:MoaD family protein [Chloroflexota bacterium]
MAAEIKVAAIFQRHLGGARSVQAQGDTVGQALDDLEARFPGFKSHITSGTGQMHQFVNIYVNDEDIRFLKQLDTPLSDGDVVSILPALVGGGIPRL